MEIEKIEDLTGQGILRIGFAGQFMPTLRKVKDHIEQTGDVKNYKNLNILACLHITTETANLLITLKNLGANVVACASNPLSTQDDVVAALNEFYKIPVFARRGASESEYWRHIKGAIEYFGTEVNIIIDDGADVITTIHKEYPEILEKGKIYGGQEETTTGVIRLRAMENQNALKIPVIAVNDSYTKHMFDNRYGTGQSTIDGILRATNILLAGSVVVVAGYGWCGKGIAQRAKGMGARVRVVEVDPIKALEAVMDGFEVMSMKEAIRDADIVITATGNRDVVKIEDLKYNEKPFVMLANAGHFDVEIPVSEIKERSIYTNELRKGVVEYTLLFDEGIEKKVIILEDGRLINLAAAEGHPPAVMDMSFSNQLYAVNYLVKNYGKLENKVYTLPREIDELIAKLKLESMGIEIEKLTPEQKKYLESWEEGT